MRARTRTIKDIYKYMNFSKPDAGTEAKYYWILTIIYCYCFAANQIVVIRAGHAAELLKI